MPQNKPTTSKISTTSKPTLSMSMEFGDRSTERIESVEEVNNEFSRPDERAGIGGSYVEEIVGHDWRNVQVHFRFKWSGG